MRTHPITVSQVPWEFLRPGHGYNNISASPNCLFYRSNVSTFYDLGKDRGINYYGGIRPGCWINMDDRVSDEKITAIFETVHKFRKQYEERTFAN